MDNIQNQIGRMKEALSVEKNTELADILEISRNQISIWPVRKKVPEKYLWKTSMLSGCSVDWIKTGEGEMRPEKAASKTSVSDDLQTMRLTIQAVEEHLQAEGKQLPPAKKAELITMLYEMFIEEEDRKVDKKTVAKLIKLAS